MRRWRIRSGRRSDHQHELARRGAAGTVPGAAGAPQRFATGGLLPVRDHHRGHLAALQRRGLRNQTRFDVPREHHLGRIETAEALQGRPLVEDRADEATGELVPLMVVTNNGLAMKSVAVARWFAGRPHLPRVRPATATRTPQPNPLKTEQES